MAKKVSTLYEFPQQNMVNHVSEPMWQYTVGDALVERTVFDDATPEVEMKKRIERYLHLVSITSTFYEEFLDEQNRIILPDKKIVLPSDFDIVTSVSEINEEMMRYLAKHPEYMHKLEPRRFEEMVARLFEDMGFSVELTPGSKDGGVDVYIARNEKFGRILYAVQCKRYAPNRPVGLSVIRNMYGVLGIDEHKPTGAIIATTSYFSRDAKKEVIDQRLENRIALHDYDYITRLMREVYR